MSRPTDGLGWLLVVLGLAAVGVAQWFLTAGPLVTVPDGVRICVRLLALGVLWLAVHIAARRG